MAAAVAGPPMLALDAVSTTCNCIQAHSPAMWVKAHLGNNLDSNKVLCTSGSYCIGTEKHVAMMACMAKCAAVLFVTPGCIVLSTYLLLVRRAAQL